MKQQYCLDCGAMVTPEIVTRQETRSIRGEDVVFSAKAAICPVCHMEFILKETHDENLRKAQDIYRERYHLLSSARVKEIRDRYKLSQKAFADVLGLGKISIARYENGYIPNEAQSNLMLLVENPDNFSALFERNAHRLSPEEQDRVADTIDRVTVYIKWERLTPVVIPACWTGYATQPLTVSCTEYESA